MNIMDHHQLKKLLSYEPDSGVFRWLIKPSFGVNINDVAGCCSCTSEGKKYIRIRFKGKNYSAHRLAWLYVYGEFPVQVIDHIDGDGTNNRINNLRSVTISENSKNLKKYRSNSSGITGVSWHKASNKWSAQIRLNRKDIYLGLFESIEEAAEARKSASCHYKFHENHGNER